MKTLRAAPALAVAGLIACLNACAGTDTARPTTSPDAPVAGDPNAPVGSGDAPSGDGSDPNQPPAGASSSGAAGAGLPPRPPLGNQTGRGCTEIGCATGVSVSFQPDAGWPAGRYTVEIDADGAVQRCEITLPLRACDTGSNAKCTGASIATIGESGCALPPAQHGLSGVELGSTPSRLRVRVSREGKQIGSVDATPSYRWVQPNGPGCGPQCLQGAHQRLTLKL